MLMHSTRKAAFLLSILLTLPAFGSATEPLGRLFFSPAERTQINRRQQEERPAQPPPSLDGIITRSAGAPSVFLNGKAVPADPQQIHMHEGTARIIGSDGRIHHLRVGNQPPESPTR